MDKKEKLIYEVAHHNIERVKEAINEGYNVNYRNKDNRTYLHIAVINYDIEITKLLVDAGAEINCLDNNNNTPLIYAIGKKDPRLVEIIKYLIDNGADIDLKVGEYSARDLIMMFERKDLMEIIKEM